MKFENNCEDVERQDEFSPKRIYPRLTLFLAMLVVSSASVFPHLLTNFQFSWIERSVQYATAVTSTQDTTPPTEPQNLFATESSSNHISLTWGAATDNVGVQSYQIFVNNQLLYNNISGTSASISTGITSGNSYEMKVRAVDASGNVGGFSNLAIIRTSADTTAPSAPTGVNVPLLVTTTKLHVVWSPGTDNVSVVRYDIYRDGTKAGIVTDGTTNYLFENLTPNTEYTFTVMAYDSAGNASPMSAPWTLKTLAEILPPETPTNLVAKVVSSTRIDLTWASPAVTTNLTGYKIYQNAVSSYTSASNSYSVTGLTPNREYTFGITSYHSTAGESPTSNVVLSRTLAESPSPTTPVMTDTTSVTTMVTPTPTKLSEIASVSFSVQVGKPFCQDSESLTPVYFVTTPSVGGDFHLINSTVGNVTVSGSKMNLPKGIYAWEGASEPGYKITGEIHGSFTLTSISCATGVVNTVPETKKIVVITPANTTARETMSLPLPHDIPPPKQEVVPVLTQTQETFPTYEATDLALRKEALIAIPESATPSQKILLAKEMRNTFALAPESATVMVGGASYSRTVNTDLLTNEVRRTIDTRINDKTFLDTDKDGIIDYDEVEIYGTNPKVTDTDKDGIGDGDEILAGTNPLEKKIIPIPYEDPKKNTIAVDTKKDTFFVENTEAILTPDFRTNTTSIAGIVVKGKALSNSYVTLYVFSTPVVATIKTDKDGRWTYVIDKQLENGQHDIYLAMTESSGKILAKSSPIPFVKTAEAVSLGGLATPVAEASSINAPDKGFLGVNAIMISVGAIALALIGGLIALSIILKRKSGDVTVNEPEQND